MESEPADRPSRETRRAQLLDAAAEAFETRGVDSTTVEDITRGAGVAKGTFYLYFDSKDGAVNAVVERMVDGVIDTFERALERAGPSAAERLEMFGRALAELGRRPHQVELAERFHRPENRVVHERMAERVGVRLVPLIQRIVERGIAQGSFRPQDPQLAAWCVIGVFQAAEKEIADFSDIAARIAQVQAFALRGLGYEEAEAEEAP